MRWQDVPLVGGSYADETRPFSSQETVNWLPMRAERPGGRSGERLKDVPGLRPVSNVGTGPIRGARNVEGRLFVVSGSKLYRIATDYTATEIGTVPGEGRVAMAHNQVGLDGGQELVIGTGSSGYVHNTNTGTFAQITDPGFPGSSALDFLGGYILGIEPQRRYWFHSELADAREYNTTDIYSAESQPDKLVGLLALNNELMVAGERSTEFFVNQPDASRAFQNATGTANDKGCAAAATLVKLDNSAFMLGADGIVYRLDGYRWVRVSHHPIEQALSRSDLSRAFAFTYEDRGHAIYYLTLPDGHTWGYDVSQGEWHRRESYEFNRWRLSTLTRWNGQWIGGDFAEGLLYEVDWDYHKEGCDPIVRRRRPGILHDNGNRLRVDAVRVVADTGQPEPAETAIAISGDLPDGEVGEVVSFQYTITRAYPGQTFTATISSGALPAGLTMNSAGLVTGTLTADGTYSWTVKVESDCDEASHAESANVKPPAIAVGHQNAPYVSVYPWSSAGFGTKYANPATPLPAAGLSVRFSPARDVLLVGHDTSGFMSAYEFDSATGIGAKIANPATAPAGWVNEFHFSPSGDAVAVAHNGSPFLAVYAWSAAGFGTKFADPATLPSGIQGFGAKFSPTGDSVAVVTGSSPFVFAYPWSGAGFGTKYADPATAIPAAAAGLDYSPDGAALAVAHNFSPFVTVYAWSSAGFGAKYADPATLPASRATGVAFDPDGAAIATSNASTPYVTAYPWSSSGFGTKFADPATTPGSWSYSVAFNRGGNAISLASDTTPFVSAYAWGSATGFGAKYANPSTLPAGQGWKAVFT